MSPENPTIKAYEEKISGQLQQTKAQLEELAARAKSRGAQAHIDAINRLKEKHGEIERKRQELKTVGDAKAEQLKAEIDEHVTKLKSSVADLATKLKEAHQKAS